MKKSKKVMSTFEGEMQDPAFAKAYREEYRELVLSELLLALMDEDDKSVRQLAKEAGLSANAIQNIRSGKSQDIRLKNFISIAEACGYHLELVSNQGERRIPLPSFTP